MHPERLRSDHFHGEGEVMAHTPGPWVTADKRFANGIRSEVEAESGIICSCIRTVNSPKHGGSRTWDEVDANAKLIAAAPDLLALAKRLQQVFEQLEGWRELDATAVDELISSELLGCDQAIDKAEGKVK